MGEKLGASRQRVSHDGRPLVLCEAVGSSFRVIQGQGAQQLELVARKNNHETMFREVSQFMGEKLEASKERVSHDGRPFSVQFFPCNLRQVRTVSKGVGAGSQET